METIAEINAVIDRSFDNVPLRLPSGAVVAELIRRGEVFRELEQTICANARAKAVEAGQTELPPACRSAGANG